MKIFFKIIALIIITSVPLFTFNASWGEDIKVGPQSFAELIELSIMQLEKVDIARMNLLCAEGLPGAEKLDIEKTLVTLDKWSEHVKQDTKKRSTQYFKNPARYDNSFSKFKAVNLALTLMEDFGLGYNMQLIESGAMSDIRSTRFFKDSKDLFLHGFIEIKTGSCSSLPVLMVAVGRRIGYPLYLVTCKSHLFCRWDDGKEKFNIETASRGVDSKPDSYYRSWPHPSTEQEVQREKYLKTLTPLEDLGIFAQIRAACLQENKQFESSAQAYKVALRAFPESEHLRMYLYRVQRAIYEKK